MREVRSGIREWVPIAPDQLGFIVACRSLVGFGVAGLPAFVRKTLVGKCGERRGKAGICGKGPKMTNDGMPNDERNPNDEYVAGD